jgi:pilus assembly protein Flp/PilA
MGHRDRPKWSGVSTRPIKLYVEMQALTKFLLDQRGQDLVEYAIVASLISLAAIASMHSVARAISTAYVTFGSRFAAYTT